VAAEARELGSGGGWNPRPAPASVRLRQKKAFNWKKSREYWTPFGRNYSDQVKLVVSFLPNANVFSANSTNGDKYSFKWWSDFAIVPAPTQMYGASEMWRED
jgi:hypothetical protein